MAGFTTSSSEAPPTASFAAQKLQLSSFRSLRKFPKLRIEDLEQLHPDAVNNQPPVSRQAKVLTASNRQTFSHPLFDRRKKHFRKFARKTFLQLSEIDAAIEPQSENQIVGG